ncbi:alpha/beta fold hydrolase [Streptomyces griseocarneus]|uniref:alpha/beta fold hydrolase n=1 Tax=Streptomyces griseocarneus TaxID=51201 RepID=UPI00167D8DE4|nr:alpha/beta hydrolase [Streptomyces griseocarneus]MBZ6476900.1 alpha/beta hydrolase [Streptomyces griseocarneus]GHG76825.1 lipase [Streptomyces griseocarneus]
MGEGGDGAGRAAAAAAAEAAVRTGGVAGVGAAAWRRGAGLAGAAVGLVAAGAAVGVAVERLTVGRGMRRKARLALDAVGPYGTLRGTPGVAVADDGTELHYEVDEVEGQPADGARPRFLGRRPAPAVTVVFSHGYCLNQDSWHFQRAALRGVVRTVFWDQRSHGRSGRGPARRDGGEPVTIDLLGRDLKAVIDAAAPEGPLVLVGHSMGGMTMMALADQFPSLIADRVAAAAFVGTSPGLLSEVTYGLPVAGMNLVRRAVLPGAFKLMTDRTDLVEKGRRATSDIVGAIIKRYSFGTRDVDPVVARFAERLIEATPVDVVAEFYPAFDAHDKVAALSAFARLPVLVLAGEKDLITPSSHSEVIADALPDAGLTVVPGAGHLVMLEQPQLVCEKLAELLAQAPAALAGSRSGSRSGGRGGWVRGEERAAPE